MEKRQKKIQTTTPQQRCVVVRNTGGHDLSDERWLAGPNQPGVNLNQHNLLGSKIKSCQTRSYGVRQKTYYKHTTVDSQSVKSYLVRWNRKNSSSSGLLINFSYQFHETKKNLGYLLLITVVAYEMNPRKPSIMDRVELKKRQLDCTQNFTQKFQFFAKISCILWSASLAHLIKPFVDIRVGKI